MNDRIDEVLEQYGDMVYKVALARTRKKEDAEDVYQDVFVKYMMNSKPFESEEHRKAWLLRVTINCSNTLLTSAWRRRVCTMDDLSRLTDGALGGIETKLENETYLAVLNLPVKYRDVIHLFYYEQMPVLWIAQVLGCKEDTVKSLLFRGRRLLEKELKKSEDADNSGKGRG
ncbi:sigma-70 family RNA polymerase sigma factor [Anaerolentibacter hominis]|uniref:sigma-70 family RNA polymerase sigma factor n=1 Tax=Anaerolentibacter hominis TaxID=3079009 RepID=UPI0031B8A7B2